MQVCEYTGFADVETIYHLIFYQQFNSHDHNSFLCMFIQYMTLFKTLQSEVNVVIVSLPSDSPLTVRVAARHPGPPDNSSLGALEQ